MLKKVMVICIALSFVFFGGIAFAGNDQTRTRDQLKDGSCTEPFTTNDSSIIIAADGPKSGHDRGPAPNSGDGIPDGPGW